jgi:hypothetical protein
MFALGPISDRESSFGGSENAAMEEFIEPEFGSAEEGEMACRERLGRLLRYYYRDAA